MLLDLVEYWRIIAWLWGKGWILSNLLSTFSLKMKPNWDTWLGMHQGLRSRVELGSIWGFPFSGDEGVVFRDGADDLWTIHHTTFLDGQSHFGEIYSSMPVYFFSNTIIPKSCVVRLEQHFQRFLWGSYPRMGDVHLMASEVVCQLIKDGAVDI